MIYFFFNFSDSPCKQTTRNESVEIEYNFENPQKRTSVTVPNNGFAIVRFKADNPGLWLFHCHTFSHLMEGQAMLFDVTDQGQLEKSLFLANFLEPPFF